MGFLLPDEVFTVVENDERIAGIHILVFPKAHFLNVTGHTYVYRSDILVDKSIVRDFIIDVAPEIMGSPGQTRTGNQETHDVENDVAAFPAFQPVVFQLVFGHNGNRVVKVGICLILFIRLRWLVVIRSKCRLLEYGQWSVAVRHSAAGCRHRAGPSEWPVGSYTGSA